ncbi:MULTISPECIES: TylF/MycF/NovP-related O-methyltransferase [unclassified Lacrimispora]|uniref:TylF/MycF/NovP-related O-methyltransferase n=1 Tax=unclassified Lacrimispora TaxID=2719232 RepID=UPI00376F9EB8
MKEIIFGAGEMGEKYLMECKDDTQIVAFVDNNPRKWGERILEYPIMKPEALLQEDYDRVVIAINDMITGGCNMITDILTQLYHMNISMSKIVLSDCIHYPGDRRINFLQKLANILLESGVNGAIAECGVYRGHFGGHMNECFPEKILYLFDTFDGFDERDVKLEVHPESLAWYKDESNPWKAHSNAEIALLRCPHREKVIVKKGYVPETFSGLENERFAFVNLDMDLYAPMLAALRFFAPRLETGGVILLHDYYYPSLHGVKQAVDEFAQEWQFTIMPIGDDCSIALIPDSPILR